MDRGDRMSRGGRVERLAAYMSARAAIMSSLADLLSYSDELPSQRQDHGIQMGVDIAAVSRGNAIQLVCFADLQQ